ncbi:MAG: ferritin-like domain-containing protein [Phycisphaeraceae bacterium]
MAVKDLNDALLDLMKDLLHAEKQLTKALPKMAKKAGHDELRQAFESHLEETQEHVTRLEQAFEAMDEKPRTKVCHAMQGLIEEGEEASQEAEEGSTRDAMLIAAAQKVEHYEIASYGTAVVWAQQLDQGKVAKLLHATLDEEKEADEKLTQIAESGVNVAAENE